MGYQVVGLVSGGKDSCYNMVQCVKYGHEIKVLAHLKPPSNVYEMDSFMYQTVGSEIVDSIAECMGLPLVKRVITGRAIVTKMDYTRTIGDEVEDLYELLKEVKAKYPTIQAVSSGAILSNYQRKRVEDVCQRLGLISLAFLWQRDQSHLLREMIENHVNAILVKVASMGLKEHMLGKSISELLNQFESLNEDHNFHICGEGGEYETLTLDCPLFKRRIVIEESKSIVVDDVPFAPVAYLRVLKHKTVKKDTSLQIARISTVEIPCPVRTQTLHPTKHIQLEPRAIREGNWCWSSVFFAGKETSSPDDAAMHAFSSTLDLMKNDGFELTDIYFVYLYISDMGLFKLINEVYCRIFQSENPPSRACVELPLNGHSGIGVEIFAKKCEKQVLHVRSVSEWAPVCIGPYSQANAIEPGFVWVAGQIALDAPTMTMALEPSDAKSEAALVWQHVGRVLDCMDSELSSERIVLCTIFISIASYPVSKEQEVVQALNAVADVSCPKVTCFVPYLPRGAGIEVQINSTQPNFEHEIKSTEELLKLGNLSIKIENSRQGSRFEIKVLHITGSKKQESIASEISQLVKLISTYTCSYLRVFYKFDSSFARAALNELMQLESKLIVPIPVSDLIEDRCLSIVAQFVD